MHKLDLRDKKILVVLSRNSRESHIQIGKFVGISKGAVAYRINRLKQVGIIKRFLTVINLTAIGYHTHNVFFKLHATKEKEDEVFHYFDNHPFIIWSCKFLGDWDFHAEIVAKDVNHYNKIMTEIVNTLGDCLEDYYAHAAIEIYKVDDIPRIFIQEAQLPAPEPVPRKWKENITLDVLDKKILYELNVDAVAPLHVLAEKCNTTLDVVHYRMKKLFETGAIIKYIPFVAIENMGFMEYFCHLHLRNLSAEKANALKNHILISPYVKYAFRGVSQLEVLFLLAVPNIIELDKTIRELKSQFFESIIDINLHLIIEQGNFTLFPKGLLES
ncbi:MAG: Lrp/AsnC family transcriptional regulator [Candidatus Woesearchaeota archaeon]|jgi:DNA-binding Lrp family transcriptional regulator